MKHFKNILIAVDTRQSSFPIVDQIVSLADPAQSHIKLVDTLPSMSWLGGLAFDDAPHLQELIVQEKQEKLDQLAENLRTDHGLKVTAKVLIGRSSIEIIREVTQDAHDLVVLRAKGISSARRGHFGTTARRLLRLCPCPVWVAAPQIHSKIQHVLACVDTETDDDVQSELNDRVFQLAKLVSDDQQSRLSVIHVWSIWNEPMLRSHMVPADFETMQVERRMRAEKPFADFLQRYGWSIDQPGAHLVKGEPFSVIPEFAVKHQVELLVMGTIARSGLLGLVIGNTAENILEEIQCSVLALKPQGFRGPLQQEESNQDWSDLQIKL